ncbi:PREDICTED: ras GTPase-activating protein 1-like [Priapulus caudatus]|uniref:Ras GTPase-activating protein 1-like n=1 Tax=Priapulus caudatus TaxID=37621 RepID=A0ABM1EBQ3_PRICU|nr:PREDICTED: ras GTPase-activating protein 1-like [Priapulus caudatus]
MAECVDKESCFTTENTVSTTPDDSADGIVDDFDPFTSCVELVDESINVSLEAPPESQWYHGRLDRSTAEERLLATGSISTYLIRESDRKPGSYVLSYLGITGINHFRITSMCGVYYIGGRQFDSLSDLIGYYTSCSDLLRGERLKLPVAPPLPVESKRKIIAILPYTRIPDTDELSFLKGDVFVVHNEMGSGWLWVTRQRTHESGLVFEELLEELGSRTDPNEEKPWFYSNVTKEEAATLLVTAGDCSYLIRPSDNSPGDYSLFFHVDHAVQRFRIQKQCHHYLMGGRLFDSLEDIIERYETEQIVDGCTLQRPVLKSSYEPGGSIRLKNGMEKTTEDIYKTIRQTHTSLLFNRHHVICKQGFLHKHMKKSKWKRFFFVLNGTEQHLLYYDNDNHKRTKPKGLIDLAYCTLYQVHDSFFEKPNCFQLVTRGLSAVEVNYLYADSPEDAQEWMRKIKPLCYQAVQPSSLQNRVKELKSLHINILDAKRIPVKLAPQAFCVVSLNDVKVARSRTQSTPDPVWEEEFLLDEIPADITSYTVTVFSRGKRAKDTAIGQVTTRLTSLPPGEQSEDWHLLAGVCAPSKGDVGSVRVRAYYQHDVVMPAEEYSGLREVRYASARDAAAMLLRCRSALKLLRHEFSMAPEMTSTLFRTSTLATKVMDLYMRQTTGLFLQYAVQKSIVRIVETNRSCELNPVMMERPSDITGNLEYLLSVLDDIMESIYMSSDSCPMQLRYIFHYLQRDVQRKWPDNFSVKTRVVSGFVFLRLFCIALLNPRMFRLVTETPSDTAARTLILVAKSLQNLANLVEFGAKEPYMECVNPFIVKHKHRIVMFLDELSNMPELLVDQTNSKEEELARGLASIHQICSTHIDDIHLLSLTKPNLKKLVAVTDMLTVHKNHYLSQARKQHGAG